MQRPELLRAPLRQYGRLSEAQASVDPKGYEDISILSSWIIFVGSVHFHCGSAKNKVFHYHTKSRDELFATGPFHRWKVNGPLVAFVPVSLRWF